MENASKALIIAGAILLSIAIIGIGMSVFNQAQNAVNNSNMSEAEISTFNSKFEGYEGPNVSGSRVKLLLDAVRSHNNANTDDWTKQIRIGNSQNPGDDAKKTNTANITLPSTVKSKTKSGNTYKVTCSYNDNTGLITQIDIYCTSNTDSQIGTTSSVAGGEED